MAGIAIFDIGLDSTEDLLITAAGDFSVAESTAQHQQQLLLTAKGDWKQNPQVGIDAESYSDDEGSGNFVRDIVKAFMADGMDIDNPFNPNSATDNSVKVFEQAYYI